MKAKQAARGTYAPETVQLSYQLLRNTTSPDETASGVRSYVLNVPAFEILKLGTKENLRSYIPEYNPRKRNKVHGAIRATIENNPQRFITRNSGFVVSAADIDVDDNKKIVTLADASIINGSQSQGELERWVNEMYPEVETRASEETPFFVRVEIIVDPDAVEVIETAIARNTATPVKSISEAGARGHLDELELKIQERHPGLNIRKSETDINVYDTRKLLQYARLLMPVSVSGNDSPSERLRPYKNPEQCLTEFSDWFRDRDTDPEAKRKYDFTLSIAPYAIEEYEYWERHEAWVGQRIWEETKKGGRACRRDSTGRLLWVSPGLVYPIMGAMSEFVVEVKRGEWRIVKPEVFDPADMIKTAVSQFRDLNSDPMLMGRSAAAYDALRILPRTLVKLIRAMTKQRRTA